MEPLYKEFCSVDKDTGRMALHVPDTFNFAYDVADRIAREEPERRALVWVQDESCILYPVTDVHERTFTFSDLSRLSNQAAHCLAARGVRKGDRVLLMMKRHYAYWYILLALHKLGAVALPAACMLNEEELIHRISTTRISQAVCLGEQALCEKVGRAARETGSVRSLFCIGAEQPGFERLDTAIETYPDTFERVETRKEDPLLLYFTSGTTGKSKIVLQDGVYPLAHIPTALVWQNVRDRGLHLSMADTGWAKASWGKIYGQWLCGSAVMAYDYDAFSAAHLMEVLRTCGVTTFCAPPTIYRFLVKNRMLDDGFGTVEYATTAGEALNAEIIDRFWESTGLQIHAGYGQTESTLLVADFVGEAVRPGAMGHPSPLYRPIIVNEEGKETAPGELGEIVIPPEDRGRAGLCMPPEKAGMELGGTVWVGDMYHTGDIAYRDEDGYFWFVGRVDDVIKSSGYRVSPFEIESILIQHPAVMECAVVGVKDEDRGFVVQATVVLRDGYAPDRAMTHDLRAFVRAKAADYKVPRIIRYAKALPKTFSGKIRHVELREAEAAKS